MESGIGGIPYIEFDENFLLGSADGTFKSIELDLVNLSVQDLLIYLWSLYPQYSV